MPGATEPHLRGNALRLTLLAAALALGGCVTLPRESCEQFESARKSTNYATEYNRDARQALKPLRAGTAMAVDYRLQLDRARVAPCSHVMIRKELTLLRRDEAGAVLEETREFFAEDGTRIAVKQENLTGQLRESGRYTASVPLPIPKKAPSGAYYLVSTLTLKPKTGAAQVLAKTAASFEVVADSPASAPKSQSAAK
jgi:hypothetical protein